MYNLRPMARLKLALALLLILASLMVSGCDDPYIPRQPDYHYSVEVTGLEDFTTANGSAVIIVPLPAVDGQPILAEGWLPDNRSPYGQERHGTGRIEPISTAHGPMLAITINMTDYYDSYARATPIAISPGQNMSGVPTITPDRVFKNWSFDDVSTIASGGIDKLDYPTSGKGRQEVVKFIERPLLPAEYVTGAGAGNYTSYVYLNEGLRPLKNNSSINISLTLKVWLNHNKVDASREGARSFEIHTFTINESIPGGTVGFIPVRVRHEYHSSASY
jgi:hypothetical protein